MVVERLMDYPFPAVCRELVLEPLGMKGYFAEEPPRPPAWIGDEPGPRTGTPTEWHNSAHFRSLCLPASGLVTTAAGALALIRAFARVPDDCLRPETRSATRDQSGGVAGGLSAVNEPPEFPSYPSGLGPGLRDHRDPFHVPAHASRNAFGHGGSIGCVAWVDPSAGLARSILGTRHMANWWRPRTRRDWRGDPGQL